MLRAGELGTRRKFSAASSADGEFEPRHGLRKYRFPRMISCRTGFLEHPPEKGNELRCGLKAVNVNLTEQSSL